MKKKTKILFTVLLCFLSILSIALFVLSIEPIELYIMRLNEGFSRDGNMKLLIHAILSIVIPSLNLLFNIFLIIYFWKNEITFTTKEELQKRKEDKKKAKIEKMEKEIERLKDGE